MELAGREPAALPGVADERQLLRRAFTARCPQHYVLDLETCLRGCPVRRTPSRPSDLERRARWAVPDSVLRGGAGPEPASRTSTRRRASRDRRGARARVRRASTTRARARGAGARRGRGAVFFLLWGRALPREAGRNGVAMTPARPRPAPSGAVDPDFMSPEPAVGPAMRSSTDPPCSAGMAWRRPRALAAHDNACRKKTLSRNPDTARRRLQGLVDRGVPTLGSCNHHRAPLEGAGLYGGRNPRA